MAQAPEFLAIGQVVADQTESGYALGGAAAYAALTAAKLGLRAAVVTRSHQYLDIEAALPGIAVHVTGAPATTTFSNQTTPEGRAQYWHGQGAVLGLDSIPAAWRKTPIVLLAPVAQEVDPAVAGLFPRSLVGASPQGWMRRRDRSGLVQPRRWRGAGILLPHLKVVVVSEADMPAGGFRATRLLSRTPLAVITQGAKGALLWSAKRWQRLPAFPARELDATGAGDVFAAAFLCAFARTRDPWTAGRYASAAASLSVEGLGTTAIPTHSEVQARLASLSYSSLRDV